MSGADWAVLLVLLVLWGGSFFFIELAVPTVAPLTLVLIRVVLAAAFLWAFLLVRRERLALPPGAALALLVLALLNNVVPFSLFAWAQGESVRVSPRSSTRPRRSGAWSSRTPSPATKRPGPPRPPASCSASPASR